MHSFREDVVDPDETIKRLGKNCGNDSQLLPSEILRKTVVTWLSKDYLCYRDAASAVACYRVEVLLAPENDLDVQATCPDCCVDVVIETD